MRLKHPFKSCPVNSQSHFLDSSIIPIVPYCTFGQKRPVFHFVSFYALAFSLHARLFNNKWSKIVTVHWLYFLSAKSPTQILHSAHKPRSDARWEREPDVRGSGLADALRQVDHGRRGADQGGGDAIGTQRAGGHQHQGVGQLHLCGHIFSGHDRSYSSGHSEGWVFKGFSMCSYWAAYENLGLTHLLWSQDNRSCIFWPLWS